MKNFYLTAFFLSLFSYSLFAQSGNLPCPTISVAGPNSAVRSGELMFFSASIEGGIKNNLEYEWKVDVGTIIAGQETTIIQVSTEGLSGTVITATFEIEGLPKDCKNKDFEAGVVASDPIGEPYDRYGKISLPDELARLDSFLISVSQDSDSEGFVWISTDENENTETVKKHILRLVKHIKLRKVKVDKFIFAIEKSSYHTTSLLIVPLGAELPECEDLRNH